MAVSISLAEIETVVHEITTDLNSIATSLEEIASELGSSSTCYVSGSLIRTPRGEVAVEDLAIGDLVVTAAGETRPIRWLGHRTVDCKRHSDPKSVLPVRIAAHAFGQNKPTRDLLVSTGHAICINVVDELLVPASALVNGATVAQVEVDEVTYWHVELDSHDILLANGLPAESFIDVGNRGFFVESQTVDLELAPDAPARTLSDYCRPFVDGGAVVQVVRDRMRHRALALDWSLRSSPLGGLHVVADGTRIDPDARDLDARFVVPATAKDVWLVSDTSVPSNVGPSDDDRTLGVCVGAVSIDDGLDVKRALDINDPRLSDGFYGVEAGSHRWTAGRARLPAELWEGCRGVFFLRVELTMQSNPVWIAPEQAAASSQAGYAGAMAA